MKYIAVAFVTYAAMVGQTSSYLQFIPSSVRMAILAAIAVAVASVIAGWRAVVLAGVIGLRADLISPGRIGIELLLFTTFAFGVQWLRTSPGNLWGQLSGTTFVGVFLLRLIVRTIDQLEAGIMSDPISTATETLFAAAVFAVAVPVVVAGWTFAIRVLVGHSLPGSTTPTERWLASSG